MVERLKAAVPHTHRAWDPEAKEWWVDQDYEDVLLEMFPAFQTFRDQPLLC